MELIEYFGYNSVLILTFFFISFGARLRVVNVPSIKQPFKSFEPVAML